MPSRNAIPKPTEAEARERRRYEVEDAVRTLTRAEQIKADPTLMADVRTLASDLKRVAGREKRDTKKPETPKRISEPKRADRRERMH